MRRRSERNIIKALELSERMVALAEKGVKASADDGCAALFGVLRDCGHRVRLEALRELESHGAEEQ